MTDEYEGKQALHGSDVDRDNGGDNTPEQIRDQNRASERTWQQGILDGLTDVLETVNIGRTVDLSQSARAATTLGKVENEKHEAQREIIEESQALSTDATSTKLDLEQAAVDEDDELLWTEEERDSKLSNYENSLTGGDVDGDYRFGINENLVNTAFLSDDVVKMRNVEDNSYTHGNKSGTSLPFIEEADITDSDARRWLGRFRDDEETAVEAVSNYVDVFNLDERMEAYEEAEEDYHATSEFEDRLESIDQIGEPTLEEINEQLDDFEGELTEEDKELLDQSISQIGGSLNGREDEGVGTVDLDHEERRKAEEDVRQLRARALDRANLHQNRLEEATNYVQEVQQEIEGTKEQVLGYVEDVQDLTNVQGVGPAFSEMLEDMGVDTVMDLAARSDFSSSPEYQEKKRTSNGNSVPNAEDLIDNAYDTLNEITEQYNLLDLSPTDTIEDVGDDYAPRDQDRRQMEAVYDSAFNVVRVLDQLEEEVPELDQYSPEWEGQYETIEEERSQVYDNLGISEPADPREALDQTFDELREE